MKEHLLKRALPFTLTLVLGAAVGGLFQLFSPREAGPRHRRHFFEDGGRRGCDRKFRRRHFAPDSRPPVILFKPDASVPREYFRPSHNEAPPPMRVSVTFGDDGKVRAATALDHWTGEMSEAAERAARFIQFVPATSDGEPTTVTEEVTIRFIPD